MFAPRPTLKLWGSFDLWVWSDMSINGLSSYTARTQVGISGQHLCAIFSSGSKIATVMEPFEFSNGGMLERRSGK